MFLHKLNTDITLLQSLHIRKKRKTNSYICIYIKFIKT